MSTSHTGPRFDLECVGLSKAFGDFRAVDEVSFSIPHGSFFSILGPSGCGKTTLLRMLAGFQRPDAGDILIQQTSVLATPPNKRPVNMVFQHLALFPTMTVAGNIAYGLKRRGVSKAERDQRIDQVLARIGLPDSGEKRIDQLSGGQKQRIAIARCLVLEPAVLLLDEPLGALDLKLREQMKVELKQLQHAFNTTFVYITHDQSEALAMSDQVAVMNHGRFEQVGTPQALYYEPATAFVAGFVGESNRWVGRITDINGDAVELETAQGLRLRATAPKSSSASLSVGQAAAVYIRPEAISIGSALERGEGVNTVQGRVDTILFDGARSHFTVDIEAAPGLQVQLPQSGRYAQLARGDAITLHWEKAQALCFPAQ
ncbi:ABC transporter ATP-binding protein [Allohahella marinimesophila]|uniref:ABC transporter ATP-binding protein n=1 Tax=Allohahella marinimesophila TaxID=1054972 RepID=A0ABP7NMY4_9GAMM